MPHYQLYIANKNYSSWSLRPWLLLSELGIAFDETLVPFNARGSSFEAYRAFSPTGKVPCLVDGDITVWDSLAITEYLAERHAGVWPADVVARAWARSASAEMHAGFAALRSRCPMSCGMRIKPHAINGDLKRDIDRIDELWNDGLRRFGGPYLAGAAFSAVDAFFAPVAFRFQSYGLPMSDDATGYAMRLLSRPAMVSWYKAALHEPWREPAHDAEVLAAGSLIADLRRETRTLT